MPEFDFPVIGSEFARAKLQQDRRAVEGSDLSALQAIGKAVGRQIPKDPRVVMLLGDEPLHTSRTIPVPLSWEPDPEDPTRMYYSPRVTENDIIVRLGKEPIGPAGLALGIAQFLYEQRRAEERRVGIGRGLGISALGGGVSIYGDSGNSDSIRLFGWGLVVAGLGISTYFGNRTSKVLPQKLVGEVVGIDFPVTFKYFRPDE